MLVYLVFQRDYLKVCLMLTEYLVGTSALTSATEIQMETNFIRIYRGVIINVYLPSSLVLFLSSHEGFSLIGLGPFRLATSHSSSNKDR